MYPDTINCVILGIHVDNNHNNSLPCHLEANQCKCKVKSHQLLYFVIEYRKTKFSRANKRVTIKCASLVFKRGPELYSSFSTLLMSLLSPQLIAFKLGPTLSSFMYVALGSCTTWNTRICSLFDMWKHPQKIFHQ